MIPAHHSANHRARGWPGMSMLTSTNRNDLQKIVVLNPKGGCGKTTLATNIASYFAIKGSSPALLDCDPQGYSMRWIERRHRSLAAVHGICAHKKTMQAVPSWHLRVPQETSRLIIDTPAAIENPDLFDLTYDASNILIPVMPSAIDIRYAARFIAELLLVTRIDRRNRQLGVVATRTRKNTKSLIQLMRFLTSLQIPLIASIRDSQNFVYAAGNGIGIYEMPMHKVRDDIQQFAPIVSWLEAWRPPLPSLSPLPPRRAPEPFLDKPLH
jgi:chromosome partitioning protein